MRPRLKFVSTCTLVVKDPAGNDTCLEVRQELRQQGYELRSRQAGAGTCVCKLDREQVGGDAQALRDQACEQVEAALNARLREWKAFVQVCGAESAWGTLASGRDALFGALPRRK